MLVEGDKKGKEDTERKRERSGWFSFSVYLGSLNTSAVSCFVHLHFEVDKKTLQWKIFIHFVILWCYINDVLFKVWHMLNITSLPNTFAWGVVNLYMARCMGEISSFLVAGLNTDEMIYGLPLHVPSVAS